MKFFTRTVLSLVLGLWSAADGRAQEQEEHEIRENPAARLEYEAQRLSDPKTQEIPADIKTRELEFAKTLPSRESPGHGGKNRQVLQTSQWRSLGPTNQGGRTRTLLIDVANEKNMVAGAASGGMWRSIDGGESWTKTSLPNDVQSVSCAAQDQRPNRTNTWYYGTGELLSTTDRKVSTQTRTTLVGNGIYKSTDNGVSWHQLPSTKAGSPGILSEVFQGIWSIAPDNSNQDEDELYAAGYGAIMRSTDGGSSWSPALGDLQKKSFATEVALTPQGICYAVLGSQRDGAAAPKQGIWRSADGIDWVHISPPGFPGSCRGVTLTIAPSNPNVVYVMTETPVVSSDILGWVNSTHRLWRYTYLSGDGTGAGGKWETVMVPQGFSSLGGYCMVLAVKPDNENMLFAGGTNLYRDTTRIGGYSTNLHPDMHAIAFLPSDPDVMFVGMDGGIARTSSCTAPSVFWQEMNNGYVSTQFYAVATDHTASDDGFIIGGLQDNGSYVYDANDTPMEWKVVGGGDGMTCAVAPGKSKIITSIYHGNLTGVPPVPGLDDKDFPFYTSFVVDHKFQNMYLPARNHLWRLNNVLSGGNWGEITTVAQFLEESTVISALAVSKDPDDLLIFGTDRGRVYRLDGVQANNPELQEITGTEFPENGFVCCIDIDENDHDRIFAIFSNYNAWSIFYSEDGGASWTAVGGNLEENPDGGGAGPSIHWVKSLKTADSRIYFAGTSVGLYSTTNLAGSQTIWVQEGKTTIGNVIVEMIDARETDSQVVIATQGSGVFSSTVFSSAADAGERLPEKAFLEQNYPNPVRDITLVRFSLSGSAQVSIKLYDIQGREIATLAEREYAAGHYAIECDFSKDPVLRDLAKGSYFYRLQAGKTAQTRILQVVE